MPEPMRCVYDAQVPIRRREKYLTALRAQFAGVKGATVTAYEVPPAAGRRAVTLARLIVMVPRE